MKLTLLFIYGTLKRNEPNYRYLIEKSTGDAVFVSNALTVNKWPLVIGSIYNIPYLLNKEGVGKQIYGELYCINDAKLKFLDDFEKYPDYYDRQQIPVYRVNDKSIDTTDILNPWVYVINNFKPGLLQTEFFENYQSLGSHGRPYVKRCDQNPNHSTIPEIKLEEFIKS